MHHCNLACCYGKAGALKIDIVRKKKKSKKEKRNLRKKKKRNVRKKKKRNVRKKKKRKKEQNLKLNDLLEIVGLPFFSPFT
jgi:hypothetical protein